LETVQGELVLIAPEETLSPLLPQIAPSVEVFVVQFAEFPPWAANRAELTVITTTSIARNFTVFFIAFLPSLDKDSGLSYDRH
jgi:hypothetical protein